MPQTAPLAKRGNCHATEKLEMERALFIFRRDLRLEDNTGLIFALKNAKKVIPAFIFTPEQIEKNRYKSDRSLQFMIESLEDLELQLQKRGGGLYLFYGDPAEVVARFFEQLKIDGVVVNRDYTPYSIKRDLSIKAVCDRYGAPFHSFEDALLNPVEHLLKADGKPYQVFTPFFRSASLLNIPKPAPNPFKNYETIAIPFSKSSSIYDSILPNKAVQQKGGRVEGLKILKKIGNYLHYSQMRDFPAESGTTHLSPHLKFTTCSPREAYHAMAAELGSESPLIRSLYWRDFFTGIAFYFPHVFTGSFNPKFQDLQWSTSKNDFNLWCTGQTGVPIVDAGMIELAETGFMHNRVRMIAASFLIKDLHIDWRWGERYFAQKLIDYDPAVNNGNWQWVAGTGCDAQPYFRIFNPWRQAAKFDPECRYIKKWIPALADLPAEAIHNWERPRYHTLCPFYPPPIVEHSVEASIAIDAYKKQ